MTTPWGALIGGVAQIADDLVTTDEERGQMALEARKIDASLMLGQNETNKVEAAHPSWWVAGWRPYVGWVAGTSLGMVYIPKALVLTGIWTYQAVVIIQQWNGAAPPPVLPVYLDLGVTDLLGLLGAMLGFGAMRSFDKKNEVDTRQIGASG